MTKFKLLLLFQLATLLVTMPTYAQNYDQLIEEQSLLYQCMSEQKEELLDLKLKVENLIKNLNEEKSGPQIRMIERSYVRKLFAEGFHYLFEERDFVCQRSECINHSDHYITALAASKNYIYSIDRLEELRRHVFDYINDLNWDQFYTDVRKHKLLEFQKNGKDLSKIKISSGNVFASNPKFPLEYLKIHTKEGVSLLETINLQTKKNNISFEMKKCNEPGIFNALFMPHHVQLPVK